MVSLSRSVEWYTPEKYIESARRVLESIDLDPASCEQANLTVKAGVFYTKSDDGLRFPWVGNVWLNPPYGPVCASFIKKLCAEYSYGRVDSAIALVNSNATDTAWFAPLWDRVLCFTNHRIQFISGGAHSSGSTHGNCFAYFGKDATAFADEFSQYGAILERYIAPRGKMGMAPMAGGNP